MDNCNAHYRDLLIGNFSTKIDQFLNHFLRVMPKKYFEANDEATIVQHLSALVCARGAGNQDKLVLTSQNEQQFTVIHSQSYPGLLSEILRSLPTHQPLQVARVFTANDHSLVIDVFETQTTYSQNDASGLQNKAEDIFKNSLTQEFSSHLQQEEIYAFMQAVHPHYLHVFSHSQIAEHIQLVQTVKGTLDVSIKMLEHEESEYCYLAYAAGQTNSTSLFKRLAHYFGSQQVDIQGAHLENFFVDTADQTALVILEMKMASVLKDAQQQETLNFELQRLPYINQSVLSVFAQHSEYSLVEAEILVGLCHLAHQRLAPENRWQYAREHLLKVVSKHISIVHPIVKRFYMKFHAIEAYHQLHESNEHELSLRSIQRQIHQDVDDEREKTALLLMSELVEATVKSNVNLPSRYGLGFRLKPSAFVSDTRPEAAFGIFFVTGKGFDGFHVRFQDIARGGIRIVQPSNPENYALEIKTLFDEVYGLSYAQQLKNKDIPEGGSKGVLLVKQDANRSRCGKTYIDALLDMITPNERLPFSRCDHYHEAEFLYLGPDENVTNDMINWIVNRAAERGYPLPSAFMSSKPSAGINHKVYGVTSEGVTVYLDVGLRALGIDPKKRPFTLKITGGPDGDVAGNEIKILHREYGENAKILGIADGSGSAEDPEGLNHQELLRLVNNNLPIVEFSKTCLSVQGRVLSLQDEGGIEARNSLHNRLVTDAFIPAGGRPSTLNHSNWQAFLTPAGTPSAKLIVEGANLFITQAARDALAQHQVAIIKDSSANKCGVICSSYEIIGSMLLPEEDFLSIKPVFVQQVVEKLREYALLEAKTLFNEYRHRPHCSLTQLSMELSQAILETTQCVAEMIEQEQIVLMNYMPLMIQTFIPESLQQVAREHWKERIPQAYMVRAIASCLASRMIYHEGIQCLMHMEASEKHSYVLSYLEQLQKNQVLISAINSQHFEGKDEVIRLLEKGGVGTALRW